MDGDVPKACPECGGVLQGYDHRKRIMKSYGGKKQYVLAPRNLCTDCGKLSTLLPDGLSPRKHYINEVRENLLDDVIDCDHVVVNNYPCEETVKFWKYELMRNTTHIEGLLKSIMADSAGLGLELLESSRSLLKELRDEGAGWLAAVNRIIYNSGNFIPVVYPPAFSSVFDDPDIPSSHKEEDYVHILFETSPQTQLSKLINNYKTVTSRLLRKEFNDTLRPYYWKPYFWSDTYFISTVSDTTEQMIHKYIQEQGQKKNDAANPA